MTDEFEKEEFVLDDPEEELGEGDTEEETDDEGEEADDEEDM